MSYVVLARKWRPMSFRDLIGQEHVSRTLANAIEQQRVAHAFLFTGVRGVGKTTSARILAKALNCLQPVSGGAAGGVEPCLVCAACREIADGTDMDVREIDGASYTGVDEIRKLQESLPYRPTRDRYKIFIVDEVHMLSQNAWNALLKTLEEPPPHVKFILATTEVHKVPVTILSRVQRFDFKMISSRLIGERIAYVLEQEGIQADARAVALVAREAAGSMRDALSLLDQVIAFSPKQLIGEDVGRVLGIAGYTALLEIGEAVLLGQPARVLTGISVLSNQSCDLTVVGRDLLGLFRDLVVAKLCSNTEELLDLSDDERQRVRQLAAKPTADDLMRVQQGFAKGFDDVSRSSEPRAALEMLLCRLALRPELLPLDGLMARLAELEARLSAGRPPPTSNPARPGSGNALPRSAPRAPASSASAAAPEALNEKVQPPPPVATPARPAGDGQGSAEPVVKAALMAGSGPPPSVPSSVATAPVKPVSAAPLTTPARALTPSISPPPKPSSSAPVRSVSAPEAAPVPPAAIALGAERPAVDPEPARLLNEWRRVLDCLGQTRSDLVAFLKHTVPLNIDGESLTLGYEVGNVLEGPMRSAECLAALSVAASTCFGRAPKIVFQPISGNHQTLAEADKRLREQQKRAAVDRAQQHPSVLDATEILGARVKRIEVGEG
jgi:DNA polymerase-3 subunit gamma/tau